LGNEKKKRKDEREKGGTLGREERFVMRREICIGKRKRNQKISLYFVQFWEMRKKKRLERKNLTEKN
jgi:hypothetical protein